ncbi:MAG: hypothetical protein ABUL67_02435, partial [Haliangium ochraceum]
MTALTALTALGTFACSPSRPRASIARVTPNRAHTDNPVALSIETPGLQPALVLDLSGGKYVPASESPRVSLRAGAAPDEDIVLSPTAWDETFHVTASTPSGLPAAVYTIRIADAAGGVAVLEDAFESLGPDTDPPIVELIKPADGARVGGDAEITV